MSESIKCDLCGATGQRRRGCVTQDGWFFAESQIDDQPANGTLSDPQDAITSLMARVLR